MELYFHMHRVSCQSGSYIPSSADLHFKKKKEKQVENEWSNILPKSLQASQKGRPVLSLTVYIFVYGVQILLEWINDELADHRIIVKDIEEDLFDGQILQNLLGEGFD